MERKYWEKIAPGYDDEIFDVLKNDKQGIIRTAVITHAGQNKKVIDIGCAVGKWLPFLSPLFAKVMAIDISAVNLSIAKERHSAFSNIEYKRADMSAGKTEFKGYDVALCVNAILTASQEKRNRFFENIHVALKKGGTLVLVVPSLESWLLTRIIQKRWNIDKTLFSKKPDTRTGAERYQHILQGNAEIDDVPTKHYLGDELLLLLSQQGFIPGEPTKIEYDWKTEFVKPPSWLKQPRPWDWMITATRK